MRTRKLNPKSLPPSTPKGGIRIIPGNWSILEEYNIKLGTYRLGQNSLAMLAWNIYNMVAGIEGLLPSLNMKDLFTLLGKPAPEFYTDVVKLLPAVQEISIAKYTPPPPIQRRVTLSDQEILLVNLAAKVRASSSHSFLQILMEMCTEATHPVEGILDSINYHQKHPSARTWVCRESVLNGKLISLCANASSSEPLAFFSRVKVGSNECYSLPLLDMRIPKSPKSLNIIASIANRLLGTRFAILETHKSYHLVGITLLKEIAIKDFLAHAILYSPITDHAYVAHQLLEGESSLRLTAHFEDALSPAVVAIGDGNSVRTVF